MWAAPGAPVSLLKKAQHVLDAAILGGAFDNLTDEEIQVRAQAMLDGFGTFGLKVAVGPHWVKARLTKGGRKRLKKAELAHQLRAAKRATKKELALLGNPSYNYNHQPNEREEDADQT